jgi:hypothetical protein
LVFNISRKQIFKVKKADSAIGIGYCYGPTFGNAIVTDREPFNGKENCFSNPKNDIYDVIGIDEVGLNKLTMTKTGLSEESLRFTISEIEVWKVCAKTK